MSTFFGLTPEHKLQLHESIFYMIKLGGGGWTWGEVYTMPTFLRNFYMNKLSESLEREQNQMRDAQSRSTKNSKKPLRPDIPHPSRKK